MRRILVVLAALLAVAGCSDDVDPDYSELRKAIPSRAVPLNGGPLAEPLSFHVVREEIQGSCPPGERSVEDEAAGTCLRLEPAAFSITRIDNLRKASANGEWRLDLQLAEPDAERFTALTKEAAAQEPPRNRVALVRGTSELLMAPTVMQPITGSKVSLAGQYTPDELDELIKRLRG